MDRSPIQIRLAVADDLSDIQSCAHAAYAKYVERIGREPAPMIAEFSNQIGLGQVRVALYGKLFVGYVVCYRKRDRYHLENVAVIPSHTGKGIGKKLVEYVEQTARENGLSAVELYTNESMIENLTFYPQLGYIETERKQQDGFNRVFFRKSIKS